MTTLEQAYQEYCKAMESDNRNRALTRESYDLYHARLLIDVLHDYMSENHSNEM